MVTISQGDVCWVDLPAPAGAGPGFRRPVVVVQSDQFNRSRIATAVCVAITSNVRLADSPGNVFLESGTGGLTKDSVANVSQIVTVDRTLFTETIGRLSKKQLGLILSGIDLVLGK